jgi:magnesium transporter
MTLGEFRKGGASELIAKEAWLGLLNGALVGIVAGLGMLAYASSENVASAGTLAVVVTVALTAACVTSGISGVIVPLALRKVGADPSTASSIFLTTATDCASMGLFLGLAQLLL